MKVYCAWSFPHGNYHDMMGVFSTNEKAKEAKERWLSENPQHRGSVSFEPYIEEIEVDKYIAESSDLGENSE